MRAAFCGKGGSGKTSLAALFTQYVLSKGYPTLAIDGDINQHLGESLFLETNALDVLPRLGEQAAEFHAYIHGRNTFIQSPNHIGESTPAGRGSQFITFNSPDPISQKFMLKQDNLSFIAMGGHNETDVGATCYHKFTGVLGALLNHLLDTDNEIVIADMCAGADPFASSGLASRFDALFLVCEPTKKSLAVFDQAKYYSTYHRLELFVLGNKIENAEDEAFIKDYVGDNYLTGFKSQNTFKKAERGQAYQITDFDAETLRSLETVLDKLKQQSPRDWKKYQETGLFFHKRAAEAWANKSYGCDMMTQIDPEFDYSHVIHMNLQAAQ